ncbi:MAG: septum formation initiator family protein [Aestuariivita sp.]|nr:septum formation initiator family protein [Aestuariivita sp.]
MSKSNRQGLWSVIYFTVCVVLCIYFTFSALHGDAGLFRRLEIEADVRERQADHEALNFEVNRMENLTKRLSYHFLDLDLLDEQARSILGLIRGDEIVIR